MGRGVMWVVLAMALVVSRPVLAEGERESFGVQAGWGMAAVGANLLYMPAKVLYAAVGSLTGGLTYALTLGNTRAVEAIWSPALGGTYVLTPAMLRGEEPILFFGESAE